MLDNDIMNEYRLYVLLGFVVIRMCYYIFSKFKRIRINISCLIMISLLMCYNLVLFKIIDTNLVSYAIILYDVLLLCYMYTGERLLRYIFQFKDFKVILVNSIITYKLIEKCKLMLEYYIIGNYDKIVWYVEILVCMIFVSLTLDVYVEVSRDDKSNRDRKVVVSKTKEQKKTTTKQPARVKRN